MGRRGYNVRSHSRDAAFACSIMLHCSTAGLETVSWQLRRYTDAVEMLTRTNRQTSTSMKVFVLAMALYPEVMRKAQAEIDRVIGQERLLDFDDRASLPHMECVMKEVLRCVSRVAAAFREHFLT